MTLDEEGTEDIRESQGTGAAPVGSDSSSGRAAAQEPQEADEDGEEAARSAPPFVVYDPIVIPRATGGRGRRLQGSAADDMK